MYLHIYIQAAHFRTLILTSGLGYFNIHLALGILIPLATVSSSVLKLVVDVGGGNTSEVLSTVLDRLSALEKRGKATLQFYTVFVKYFIVYLFVISSPRFFSKTEAFL